MYQSRKSQKELVAPAKLTHDRKGLQMVWERVFLRVQKSKKYGNAFPTRARWKQTLGAMKEYMYDNECRNPAESNFCGSLNN
jgi:hypothetical protein